MAHSNRSLNRLSRKDHKFRLELYKKLQVLQAIANSCVRRQMLPACSIGLPAVQFAAGFVCLKFHDSMSLPAMVFFSLIYVDAVILTTCVFTAASHVFINSLELLSTWKTRWQTRGEVRKSLRSLTAIKIRFGNNFVDNSTPLVIQDMCTRQTATSLLISK